MVTQKTVQRVACCPWTCAGWSSFYGDQRIIALAIPESVTSSPLALEDPSIVNAVLRKLLDVRVL